MKTYSSSLFKSDLENKDLTDWFPVDSLKLELITNGEGAKYGFKVNNVSTDKDAVSNVLVNLNNSKVKEESAQGKQVADNIGSQDHQSSGLKSIIEDIISIVTQNPLISGIIATVVGGIILAVIRDE